MTSSRREFLKRGALMALAAGVPLGLSEKISGMEVSENSAGSGLNRAAFEAQLNTPFFVNREGLQVEVTLVEVANFASRKQIKAGKEGFSLLFTGPKSIPLQQNTYLIEHATMGLFSFLIVPVGTRDKSAAHYEAVINRLHP